MILILHADGSATVELKLRGEPSLEWVQKAVGGYVKAVYSAELDSKGQPLLQMLMDEESKVRAERRPVRNIAATALAHRAGMIRTDDWIANDVVLLDGKHRWT